MKAISADALIIMILIGLSIVVIVTVIPNAISGMGWNLCIRDQFQEISKIEGIAKEMELGMEKSADFDVMWCTKCIWFEKNETHKWLKVWIKHESEPEIRFVENEYSGIGTSKDDSRLNRDDFEYIFWIKKGEVRCINCDDEAIEPGCH